MKRNEPPLPLPPMLIWTPPCLLIIPNIFLLTRTEIDDLNTNNPISKFQ